MLRTTPRSVFSLNLVGGKNVRIEILNFQWFTLLFYLLWRLFWVFDSAALVSIVLESGNFEYEKSQLMICQIRPLLFTNKLEHFLWKKWAIPLIFLYYFFKTQDQKKKEFKKSWLISKCFWYFSLDYLTVMSEKLFIETFLYVFL